MDTRFAFNDGYALTVSEPEISRLSLRKSIQVLKGMHFKITDIREDFIVGYSKESLQADRGRIESELSAAEQRFNRGINH